MLRKCGEGYIGKCDSEGVFIEKRNKHENYILICNWTEINSLHIINVYLFDEKCQSTKNVIRSRQ